MPLSNYLRVVIGDIQVETTSAEDLNISIDYSLENPENFSEKTSGQALGVKIPATLINSVASNTYYSPSIEDLTSGELFKNFQSALIENNGCELAVGKARLRSATHTDKPIDFTHDIFTDNADWLLLLKDKTLYDFLQHITFIFDKTTIQNSWAYDGTNEALPYCFIPVRYRYPMNGYVTDENNLQANTNNVIVDDDNMAVDYLRPSISKYFIIYWGLKSLGYKLASGFMDTEYFRRQCAPWTWGSLDRKSVV